jgi:hypothetical protein
MNEKLPSELHPTMSDHVLGVANELYVAHLCQLCMFCSFEVLYARPESEPCCFIITY